jgi:hypothetical protein
LDINKGRPFKDIDDSHFDTRKIGASRTNAIVSFTDSQTGPSDFFTPYLANFKSLSGLFIPSSETYTGQYDKVPWNSSVGDKCRVRLGFDTE